MTDAHTAMGARSAFLPTGARVALWGLRESYIGPPWCLLAWETQHTIKRDKLHWRFPMNIPAQPDQALEQRLASVMLDVLIRAGLLLAMAMLCYQVLSSFLTLIVWALILAVTLYPLHLSFASKLGGKQGLAATLVVVVGIVLLVV